jgi:hypothetical protein
LGLQLLPRKQTPNIFVRSPFSITRIGLFLLNELYPLMSYKGEECVGVGVLGEFVHPHELPDSMGMLIPENLRPKNYASKVDPSGVGHNLMGSQVEVTQ